MEQDLLKLVESKFENFVKVLREKVEEPLSAKKAAEYLGMKLSYFYKLSSRGEFPVYRPNGKLIYFKKHELDRWVYRNRSKSQEELENGG